MGAVNKGARSMNGEITGVIHERWCIDGTEDNLITNMIVVGMISSFLLFVCIVRSERLLSQSSQLISL